MCFVYKFCQSTRICSFIGEYDSNHSAAFLSFYQCNFSRIALVVRVALPFLCSQYENNKIPFQNVHSAFHFVFIILLSFPSCLFLLPNITWKMH